MRIAVPLPGTMWAFDVISIIQIFDDDSVMYGSSDRPVIDFIANASSKALDHGMSIATTALRDYHEKPDLIIIPGFANPHEIATDRRTGDAKARLFTADPADALAIRDWLVASHREGVEIAAMCTGVFALAWTGLLDGVECTTHLPFLDDLAAQFPKALVQKDRLLTQREAAHLDVRRRQHLSRPVHRATRRTCRAVPGDGGGEHADDALPPFGGHPAQRRRSVRLAATVPAE